MDARSGHQADVAIRMLCIQAEGKYLLFSACAEGWASSGNGSCHCKTDPPALPQDFSLLATAYLFPIHKEYTAENEDGMKPR